MRRRRLLLGLASIMLGLPSTPAVASSQRDGPGGSYLCLKGAPPPACRGFIRVELRGGGPLGDPQRYQYIGAVSPNGDFTPSDSLLWTDLGDWIGAEVGYAVNTSSHWAIGASAAIETGSGSRRFLARARARRWLASRLYAEVLPGVFRQEKERRGGDGEGLIQATGFSAELRAGLSGLIFASARLDVLDAPALHYRIPGGTRAWYDPGGPVRQLSIGGGLEGRTAIGAVALVLVGAAVYGLAVGLPAA